MAMPFEFSQLSAERPIATRNLPRSWFHDDVFRSLSCESMGSPRLHIDSQLDIATKDRAQLYSSIVAPDDPVPPSIAAPGPESPRERLTAVPASPVDLGSIDEISVKEVDLHSAVTSHETSKLPTFDDDFDGVVEYWGSLENPQKLMVSTVDEGSPYDYQRAWSLGLAAENELSGSPDTIVDDDPLFKAPFDVSKLDHAQIIQTCETYDLEAILADFDWERFCAQEEKLQPQRLDYEGSVQPEICDY